MPNATHCAPFQPSGVITLTTDFGHKDPFVGVMKGQVLRRFPAARLVYLVETSAAPVWAHNSWLADVITVPHRRGWRRLLDDVGLGSRLRRERFVLTVLGGLEQMPLLQKKPMQPDVREAEIAALARRRWSDPGNPLRAMCTRNGHLRRRSRTARFF